MAISFDKALGIHQYTLEVRNRRSEVLSGNIANADTPGYKAQDLDFEAALEHAKGMQQFNLSRTHEQHIQGSAQMDGDLKFRIPEQPDTGDGNTVDVQRERTEFFTNHLQYQSSLTFLNSKISGLLKAIKGGQR
ncbi:flagellar basal body rod protein FlgB [Dongshaea marina]|uniref:flagellar basal body rod protein FlgB n=1 Tax=Dongshaea marina TaxID=2047966 RepID=UPI000D3EB8C1|nr:flagellar basal body rod protein FlgB [Dongshaea marina]